MFGLNILKSSFSALLLVGFIINSSAQLTDVESDLLEDIGVWIRAQDVVVSEFLGSDKDKSPEQNLPSHNINEFYNLSVGQGNTLGSISDSLLDFRIDYLNRNRANSVMFTNITEYIEYINSWNETQSRQLNEIFMWLSSGGNFYEMMEALATTYYETEYNENQQIVSLLEQIASNSNQQSSVDMGIVTNIYYNTQSLSNNVDYIANYISTNQVDVENPISQSQSEAQSLFSLDTAESFYTNQITKTVDLDPEEPPGFEQYTNSTDLVTLIQNNYDFQQFQSTTNQLISSLQDIKTEAIKTLDYFKRSDFFNRQYNTKVVLIKKGTIKNYPDFGFEFDFNEMKLPSIVTTFLSRVYDLIYSILCLWALFDILKWGVDKFGD